MQGEGPPPMLCVTHGLGECSAHLVGVHGGVCVGKWAAVFAEGHALAGLGPAQQPLGHPLVIMCAPVLTAMHTEESQAAAFGPHASDEHSDAHPPEYGVFQELRCTGAPVGILVQAPAHKGAQRLHTQMKGSAPVCRALLACVRL